jgi:hypothetical protein
MSNTAPRLRSAIVVNRAFAGSLAAVSQLLEMPVELMVDASGAIVRADLLGFHNRSLRE